MGKMVTLSIDGKTLTVPAGTLIVDAAQKAGIGIPVFCFHPKLKPVGMCRMCLVDIGRPVVDRTTGEVVREADGSPKVQFGPKLETACTTPVLEGMVVVTASEKVKKARKDVLEFLLTSHPLDCPICDKGGECPLQNLTLEHGPAQSRFLFDEKAHNQKHVPLGDLIWLDRERCIQCGRCVRFETEIAGDPVIGFCNRGRSLEIVTHSRPGFDSIFSGNATDICPVGALTTADFRFGARPWEMKPAASLCNHCPVGCNITFNVRREVKAGGKSAIKRVMPRQNEQVNEIWMCDKGRFAYHYAEDAERLTQPLLRKDGELVPVGWEEALEAVTYNLSSYGSDMLSLAGGRLTNEDLYNLFQLTRSQGGQPLLYSYMAGGDLTAKYGLPPQSNLSNLGKGSAILVVASDLHEEAPLWWLRVKQAAERGAALIVMNPRSTRLDAYARFVVRYAYGDEEKTLRSFLPENRAEQPDAVRAAADAFARADNAVIFYGSEGIGLPGSGAVAQAAVELLVSSDHFGRPDNGLVGVWHSANLQGAWDMGFRPVERLAESLSAAGLVYIAGADPAGDDSRLANALQAARFVVVHELFLTQTAQLADVVLPVQAYTEREGTYTSGERRVQRFYPALPPRPETRSDFAIVAQVGKNLRRNFEDCSASQVFNRIADSHPLYHGLSYEALSAVEEQQPVISRRDLYYGGTGYENRLGLGVQLELAAGGEITRYSEPVKPCHSADLFAVPVNKLYDRGSLVQRSEILREHLSDPALHLHPLTAREWNLDPQKEVEAVLPEGVRVKLKMILDETVPLRTALIPRGCGLLLAEPVCIQVKNA